MSKLFTSIAVAVCVQAMAIGASATGDATCSFVLITTVKNTNSASSASLLEAAVSAVAGKDVVVLSPTKPLERGMLGGKVVFSGETALADATELCDSIKEGLTGTLDESFGQTTFVATNVLDSSTIATRRGKCWSYNWICWMQCNRGYKPYSSKCCCT